LSVVFYFTEQKIETKEEGMFKRLISRRNQEKKKNAGNMKLARKLLEKDSGRRVFGFPCSPNIQAKVKMLAGRLNVPIFALAEHELELANWLVEKMEQHPEEREHLLQHIREDHIETRTLEMIGRVDPEMANNLDKERSRRWAVDNAVRQIVASFVRRGLKPEEIPGLIDYGFRCRAAMAKGLPIPNNGPPRS
jgi:hypothetical protein